MGMLAALVLGAGMAVGDGLPRPLTDTPGDAERGRALVGSRQQGLCLLCHRGPASADFPQPQLQGTLATDLAVAGARWSEAQLRLRVADSRRLNPEGLQRVGRAWQGRPVLDAQQVEDVVAYLKTLR